MSCNCCVFKSVQNCNLLFYRPFAPVLWDEKLINVLHVENDFKVYEWYKRLFQRTVKIGGGISFHASFCKLLLGDRIQALANYYIYCYDYRTGFLGQRVIYVGVIDWQGRVFTTAEIVCGVYPKRVKTRGKQYIELKDVRNIVTLLSCSTLKNSYDSNSAKPHILQVLDDVVTIFIQNYEHHEDRIQQTVLDNTGACLSLRLTQFLKYAIHLQRTVLYFCQSNCTCGGFSDECYCPIPCSCLEVYVDAKKFCSDEVFFGTPMSEGKETL